MSGVEAVALLSPTFPQIVMVLESVNIYNTTVYHVVHLFYMIDMHVYNCTDISEQFHLRRRLIK